MIVGSEERQWAAPIRLARQITIDVIDTSSPVGTHLGSLPEIAERYGISVPTLRKAVTYLVDDGFVAMREGRGGGLSIAAPPAQTAIQGMYIFFAGLDIGGEHIREARDLINVALAERACRLVDAEDQTTIAAILQRTREPGVDLDSLIRTFDEALLRAAKQPVLSIISTVLVRLETKNGQGNVPDLGKELMLRRELSRAVIGGNLADAITLRRSLRPLPPAAVAERSRSSRLADQIILSVKEIIETHRLNPGDELGRERDLQARFGVGRSTLRDALRPLERGGAIKIVQGRGGGIFVGSTEPYAAVQSTALYLSSIQLDLMQQIESREVVEARAAWLAAERATPEIRLKLRQAMDADRQAIDLGLSEWSAKGAEVERLIAGACGNPLLEFFTLALVELSLIQTQRQGFFITLSPEELARGVSGHHDQIVDAIVDGMPAKAAFKTRQYVRALGRWTRWSPTGFPAQSNQPN